MDKELTPRQVREREAREFELAPDEPKRNPVSTRDFLRKQAGWPVLRKKG